MANILLAEDDTSMASFIVLALERAGHNVTPTNNGLDALNEVNNSSNKFDLLLTDIVIPGIDGIELAKKTAEKLPDIRIMFITGFAAMAVKHDNDADISKEKLLPKPFHLNELVEQVENLLLVPAK